MDAPEVLTFEPWADPALDAYDAHPEGPYSRLAWLPVLGPSAWLVWGTLAAQLRREPTVVWDFAALAEAHGLARGAGRHGLMRRTLTRLCLFHLAADDGESRYLVRLCAPPVSSRQLERLPAVAGELHHRTFGIPCRQAG